MYEKVQSMNEFYSSHDTIMNSFYLEPGKLENHSLVARANGEEVFVGILEIEIRV